MLLAERSQLMAVMGEREKVISRVAISGPWTTSWVIVPSSSNRSHLRECGQRVDRAATLFRGVCWGNCPGGPGLYRISSDDYYLPVTSLTQGAT